MSEKERRFCSICNIVGGVAILVHLILTFLQGIPHLFVIRLIFACIATVAFAIKFGIELLRAEKYGYSLFLFVISLLNIVVSAMELL